MDIDTTRLFQWIEDKWTEAKNCPICGSNNWNTTGKAWECREFHGGALQVGGASMPLVDLMCNVCGYVLLFNGIAVGVVERAEKKEAESHG